MERTAVAEIKAGRKITSTFIIKNKKIMYFRDKPGYFLSLLLGDKTGQVEAKIWERAEDYNQKISPGDLVVVSGDVKEYNGTLQVNIHSLRLCGEGEYNSRDFLPSSPRDVEEMLAELKGVADAVSNPHFRDLLLSFFSDREWLNLFIAAPAAKINHQAYLGGLLEHTLNVARAAASFARLYPQLDKDLLLTGAILHDIGKVEEYRYDKVIDFTDRGRLLGHIMLGASLVEKRMDSLDSFPEKLKIKILHIIASHHGQYEWQSPKRPKFLEAAVIHQLDQLDATVDTFIRGTEENQDPENMWTAYNRTLERHIYLG